MPDFLQFLLGPLAAVLVAVSVQIWLVKRDEKRRARLAFAEAMERCCEDLESAAIHYWTDEDAKAGVLAGKIGAGLAKVIRLVRASPCVREDEERNLTEHWGVVQRAVKRGFAAPNRRMDPDRMTIVVGAVIGLRCEVAKMRA